MWAWLELGHTQNVDVVVPTDPLVKILRNHHWSTVSEMASTEMTRHLPFNVAAESSKHHYLCMASITVQGFRQRIKMGGGG